MRAEDLAAGVRLTQAEGWPHRLEDWAFHYRLGRGWVACDDGGVVVGTAMWWPYGATFGSVGLVVVDRAQQGKGLGRRLMQAVIEDAGPRTLQLVATQAGLKLYRQCGFREWGGIEQRQGIPKGVVAVPASSGASLRASRADDLAALYGLDAAVFGADRRELIAALFAAAETGVVAEREGRLVGFALRRMSGRGALIGPIVAADPALALALVSYQLSNSHGFTRIDLPSDATELAVWLETAGLACVDRVTTMVRGDPPRRQAEGRVFGLVSQALS